MGWQFYWQLASLSIIVIYACLVFRNVDPLVATALGVILGFGFNHSTPIMMGKVFESALGSFLALVGFIIMLGRGLGEVLAESYVSHTLVYRIVYGIGVNTKRRVKIGIVASSLVIVAILGTLAGGLAILAPILRPIAASVGLNRNSLAILMQAAGEEALILGPFAPPVIAILGVTGLSYPQMLGYAALPIAAVTLISSWIMAGRLERQYPTELVSVNETLAEYTPTKRQNWATLYFGLMFVACVIYGLTQHAATSFVIVVMLFLALTTGLVAGLKLNRIFELLLSGMKKNFHLFMIFILLGPMLDLVQSAGGFAALLKLFVPLEHLGGKAVLSILIGLTGAFGMPAASAAVIKMLHEMFAPMAGQMQLSLTTFAFSMLLATRITNFAIPGANMFAAMGFADSQNLKAMIKNGLAVTLVQIAFLASYSLLMS
jgi:H+/gluconate symporter-like permease